MQAIIEPGNVYGSLQIPASKSMMQRVCAAALLHTGKTIIHNQGRSADDLVALNIIKQCGAVINEVSKNCIEITGNGIITPTDEIQLGESGLSARLFIPILALSNNKILVNGNGSLLKRPMHELQNILPKLGVTVSSTSQNGHLPFYVQGPLLAKDISVDGSISSQYLTGLLFAFTYSSKLPVSIAVANLKSSPYIDLTLAVLKQFGHEITHDDYSMFHIPAYTHATPKEIHIYIEGDWSSASYWLVAGAIAGNVTLRGLDIHSSQADKAILNVLKEAGCTLHISYTGIQVKQSRLRAFTFDATHCPDLFPALAILAACSRGESVIKGIHRLLHKESNRAESITEMLEQFGVFYSVNEDSLIIEGRKELEQASIDSFNDHRIAMAASIGALRAVDTVIINRVESVSKSYPDFFSHLQLVGGECTIKD